MNDTETDLTPMGYLAAQLGFGKTTRKPIRNIGSREAKDPETVAVINQHREKLRNLVAFSTSKELPPCPKCGARLFFEREIREESRLLYRSGGHSTDVIKIDAGYIWVRADFFE